MTQVSRDEPSATLRGLRDDERQMTVEAYFERFSWQPRSPDPRRMTPEQFFVALDDAAFD